jgi:transketolase C-terminal domain/subunit
VLGGAIAELPGELHLIPMRFVGITDEFLVIRPTAQVQVKYGVCDSNISINTQNF